MKDVSYDEATILVVCESSEGKLEPISLSLLGEALAWRSLERQEPRLVALTLGETADMSAILGSYGVQKAFLCPDAPTGYAPDVLAHTIAQTARECAARWIFLAHTPLGSIGASRGRCARSWDGW